MPLKCIPCFLGFLRTQPIPHYQHYRRLLDFVKLRLARYSMVDWYMLPLLRQPLLRQGLLLRQLLRPQGGV